MSGIKGMNTGKQNIHYVHGETKTRLHKIWGCMHERCERVKHPHYDAYGGRGINVCDEWKEYLPFAEWARNNGYTDELTIDRIDVNGNYEPENCRWATRKEQSLNKRSNVFLEYNGKRKTLGEWAEEYNINRTTLTNRLRRKWSVEKSLTYPVGEKYRHKKKGE